MLGPWIKVNWKWSTVMTRVNTDILENSELKWTGMGEFKSDDHYIYFCRQESLRRNGLVLIVNERVWNAVLGCNLKKRQDDLCLFPRQTIQYHSLYAPTSTAEEAEVERFFEDLQDLLELTPKKDVLFIIGDWMQK